MLYRQRLQTHGNPVLKEALSGFIVPYPADGRNEKFRTVLQELGQERFIAKNWNIHHLLAPTGSVTIKYHQR
jgi:hypothetical protein